ncbi:MAG TPA: immunoglobulin domain-containing protein, partial [Candidatus Acidoferrum sp.]|nr:immunoglobulin domain-containing protein [Candidatus Acidoferrum sp.]
NTAFPVTITAQNLTNGVASGFAGPVALSAGATGAGPSATIIGSLSYNSWISGSEMTLGYAFTPSTNVQVIAVRGYNTDKVSIWTDSGVLLGSQAVSASGSWTESAMASPVTLSAGTTYRVGSHLPSGMNGYYRSGGWPTTFANGAVGQNFYYSYGDVCPTTVHATSAGPLVDLRYQVVFSNSVAISPTTSGAFTSGVWNGNITVAQIATNVVVKADDGSGHVAFSNPFNVVDPNAMPPRITTQPQSRTNNTGDNVTFSLVAVSGPTPTYYWRRNSAPIAGANSSSYALSNVQLPDSGSLFSCVVSNSYGAVTSQTATLTVTCSNVVLAAVPGVTLNPGGAVRSLAPLPDGSLVFGGSFTNVNGLVRSNLARLTPTGTLDPTWNPDPNNSVFAIALSGTNLYVGGAFTAIGGTARNYIAKLGTAGAGTADDTWNPNANDWVVALAANGTDLYAGGYFSYIGQQNRGCIAKLGTTGAGAADATWNPNAVFTANDPEVEALAVSGTNIYAGGYFTNIGGLTRYGIARLSTTGSGAADSTWNPSANSEVYAVAANGSGVYVAGAFTYIGGQNRTNLAKLNPAGTGLADATWNPSPDSAVYAIGLRGLCLYVGGTFANIGGLPRGALAKLSTFGTGAADNTWEADCNGASYAICPGSTALFVGGAFTQVAAQARAGVAALTFAPLRLALPQCQAGGQFQCTLCGERYQGFTILSSTNLQNWDTVMTLTNTTGSTNFTDTATGFQRRFYRAQQFP